MSTHSWLVVDQDCEEDTYHTDQEESHEVCYVIVILFIFHRFSYGEDRQTVRIVYDICEYEEYRQKDIKFSHKYKLLLIIIHAS